MSNKSEVNEIFSYLSKNNEISSDKITQIFEAVYPTPAATQNNHQQTPLPAKSLTKSQFQAKLNQSLKQKDMEEELLCLFYNLDRQKKGYLTPDDIIAMFKIVEKNISLNEVENSFKYAKVYKNKMTFDDFKQYFHNF